jgi:hypothetical protein
MAQVVSRRPPIPESRVRSRGQSMWDLWWTKCHWDRFLPEYFGFPLSVSFHRCSITRKNEKTVIIFITGLHNKPQGCDASEASAAGPFTKKNTYTQIMVSSCSLLVWKQMKRCWCCLWQITNYVFVWDTNCVLKITNMSTASISIARLHSWALMVFSETSLHL